MAIEVPLAELSQPADLLPQFFVAFEAAVVDNRFFPAVPLHLPLPLSDLSGLLDPLLQLLELQSALVLKHYVELELAVVVLKTLLQRVHAALSLKRSRH